MIYDEPSSQQMILLAFWRPDGVLELQQDSLRMISNFFMGQINIICFEGFQQKRYDISQQIGKSTIRSTGLDNCLLIRPKPIYQKRTHKYLYILEMIASNEQAKEDLHLFAALISNVIIVAIGSGERVTYLGLIANRIDPTVSRGRQMNNMNNGKAMKTSVLVCIEAIQNQNNPEYIIETTDKLINRFSLEGIQNEVLKTYPVIKGFECSDANLIRSSRGFEEKLMQEIQIVSSYQKANNQLMYGRILVKYMQNICNQINSRRGGMLDIDKAQDDIVIDQGYEAYMAGVQQYHNSSLSLIDKNQRPDDNQLQQMLDVAKGKAFQQFYARGGSTNLQYRKMLQDYIGNKNRQVIDAYSGQQWNRNLQILQVESKDVLDRIAQSKTRDQATIMSYINDMTRNYESQAKGPQKYEILNDYMKVFTPIAFEPDPEKQAMLRKQQKRNQQLQKRLAQLKKRRGGCCSKCSIM